MLSRNMDIQPSAKSICPNPSGGKTVSLPKHVMALLDNPPAHSISTIPNKYDPQTGLLVANTRATDHVIPNKSAFISYQPCTGCQVRVGNSFFSPIMVYRTAVISLNCKKILVQKCLHVPALWNPLYSLKAHQQLISMGADFFECMVWECMSSSPCLPSKLAQLSMATSHTRLLVRQQHFCRLTMSNPSLCHQPLLQPQFPRPPQ